MKNKVVVMTLVLIMCLAGCEYTGKVVGDYNIEYLNSNSIVVKRNKTASQIFKAYDENGKACLVETSQPEIIEINHAVNNIIELPEIITDFEIVGFTENNVYNCSNLLIDTNDGLYLIAQKIDVVFDYKYDIFKVKNDYFNERKNVLYKSINQSYHEDSVFMNGNLKYSTIINSNNNVYLKVNNNEVLLVENITLDNSFYLISIDDNHYVDNGFEYNNIVLIDKNNKVYYFVISPDLDILISKEYFFNGKILNYGPIIEETYHSQENNPFLKDNKNYFYILTDNALFIYDKLGELVYNEVLEAEVYGINFINNGLELEYQIAYKMENNLFKWEKNKLQKGIE